MGGSSGDNCGHTAYLPINAKKPTRIWTRLAHTTNSQAQTWICTSKIRTQGTINILIVASRSSPSCVGIPGYFAVAIRLSQSKLPLPIPQVLLASLVKPRHCNHERMTDNSIALVSSEKSNFQFILRLLNTNVDGKQKIMYALTKIKGVGRRYSNLVCKKADVDLNKRYIMDGRFVDVSS